MGTWQFAPTYIYKESIKTKKNLSLPVRAHGHVPLARSIFFKRYSSFVRFIFQKRPLQKDKNAFTSIYKESIKIKNILPRTGTWQCAPCSKHFFQRKPSFIRFIFQKRSLRKGKKATSSLYNIIFL